MIRFLFFAGHASAGSVGGMNLALCAVNMAEAAGSSIGKELLAEIYATVAVNVKLIMPSFVHFVAVSKLNTC